MPGVISVFCLPSKNLEIKIYRTIILPVIFYECENWSLTLREEHGLRVYENRVLTGEYLNLRRRKWREDGEECIMRSFITCMFHQILT
jgi:hypothetical protein